MTEIETTESGCQTRPYWLAGIGMVAALIVQQVLDVVGTPPVWRTAFAFGLIVATLAVGFSVERRRLAWAVGFAAALGIVAGSILYWNSAPQFGTWGDWRYAALLLGLAITVPLFQVGQAEGAWGFPITGSTARCGRTSCCGRRAACSRQSRSRSPGCWRGCSG